MIAARTGMRVTIFRILRTLSALYVITFICARQLVFMCIYVFSLLSTNRFLIDR